MTLTPSTLTHLLAVLLTLLLALVMALFLRPWRMLYQVDAQGRKQPSDLVNPAAGLTIALFVLWSLPFYLRTPINLHLSLATLTCLMLGWPLAVWVLTFVGLLLALLMEVEWSVALAHTFWMGIVPATLSLVLGSIFRAKLPAHPFVYILGRGFLGSVAALFVSFLLLQWTGQTLIVHRQEALQPFFEASTQTIALWLLAFGDGFLGIEAQLSIYLG